MESRAGTTNRKHPRVLSTNKSTSGGKEWRRRTTTVPRSSSCRRRACRRCSDHAPPHRTVAPTLPSEQDPLPPRRGNLCSAVVALEADASRREGTHFCVVSLLQRKMDPSYASSVGGWCILLQYVSRGIFAFAFPYASAVGESLSLDIYHFAVVNKKKTNFSCTILYVITLPSCHLSATITWLMTPLLPVLNRLC